MIRKDKLPELLAPAGDFESLIAAVRGGADAVYVGAKSFSARAYAKNFDMDELRRGVRYCHLHGVRLYVTVNTLLSDKELATATELVRELWEIGVDAIIAADVGLIRAIRESGCGIELHASTQLSVHNSIGADEAARMGCSRVVLARELSLENIRAVTEACVPETEIFVHGALCVCHSGQCLMSSMIGGRSGNRGECAQPCRLPYNGSKYPLSLRDLSLAAHVPALIASGAASLKIEGRMKSPGYVYTVTSIYRRLLDEGRAASAEEEKQLRDAFSRGGFTDGYFVGRLNNMTGVRSELDKELSKRFEDMSWDVSRTEVVARVEMRLDESASLTLSPKNERQSYLKAVTVYGAAPRAAKSAPLTEHDLAVRISKMGQTLLSLSPDDVSVDIDEGINLSPGEINALRRMAADAFESQKATHGYALEAKTQEKINNYVHNGRPLRRTAMVYNTEVLSDTWDAFSTFDAIFVPLFKFEGCKSMRCDVAIPPVVMEDELAEVRQMLRRAKDGGAKYALVGNIGGVSLAEEAGLVPVGDFRLNVTNSTARAYWESVLGENIILSSELTLPAVKSIRGGTVVFGRIPLMITERCFTKDIYGCSGCGKSYISDRRGYRFPMLREYKHRTLIMNSTPTYAGDIKDELRHSGVTLEHFIFSDESGDEVRSVISDYESGVKRDGIRRIGRR